MGPRESSQPESKPFGPWPILLLFGDGLRHGEPSLIREVEHHGTSKGRLAQ